MESRAVNGRRTAGRILEAAERLFYREGIRAVGMDAVKEEAGVALNTLYRHFPSKEALVEAYLVRRDERWRRWLEHSVEGVEEPRERLLALFEALGEWFGSQDFRGCAFINAAGEIGSGNPLRLAGEHKRAVRGFVERLVAGAGFGEPDRVAAQLMLLVEGAIVTAYVERDPEAAARARQAAEVLLRYEERRAGSQKGP